MAEMLNAANAAYDQWLQRTPDSNKPDSMLLYMAFLAGFQAGNNYAEDA